MSSAKDDKMVKREEDDSETAKQKQLIILFFVDGLFDSTRFEEGRTYVRVV
jgi:hypothetical protein